MASRSTIGRGRGYDDSVPGEVTKTVPSGDKTTLSLTTWSANFLRIQLITIEGWSINSPGWAIFVPSPKTGINLRHPRAPQSLNDSSMRVAIFGDNESAKVIVDNPSSASRSKHIDVKLNFIRGMIRTGEVRILHVGTEEQHVHVPTKALWRNKFLVHRAALMNFSSRKCFKRVFCSHLVSS